MTRKDEQADLDAFFAAARDEPEAPLSPRLTAAILADAAAVTTARGAAVPAPPRRAMRPAPARRIRRAGRAIGGWRGVAALAGCAAVGFWVGMSGALSIDGTTVWAGQATADATSEMPDDPVAAFYDLAALEG